MSTAADPAGPPEETPGAPPSRTDGASPRAPKGGGRTKPPRKAREDEPAPEVRDEEPPRPQPPAAEPAEEETGEGGGDGEGGRPPPSVVAWSWKALIPYVLAGLIGGIVAAAVLLLSGRAEAPGGVSPAPQPDAQTAALASETAEQVAALRRQVEELGGRLDNIDAAASKLSDLEQFNSELTGLDSKLARLAGEAARIESRLGARLEALEAVTPEDLPQLLDRTAAKTTVEALSGRVARLERDELTSDVRRAALALALANLTRAAQTSGPFLNELSAIEALDPGNEQAAALKPYAETGLPSLPVLVSRFETVAGDVVKAHRKARGEGVLGRLWDNIRNLFRVRPVGEAEGADAPAIVARAERRLADGELALAVQELAKLGAPEKDAAADWLAEAAARLRLDRLVSAVNADVLREIAQAQAARKALREQPAVPEAAAAEENSAPSAPASGPEAGTEDGAAPGAPER